MGCGEFSAGRRVSEVERIKQIQRRQSWLKESRRLGYDRSCDSDHDSLTERSGDESATEVAPARGRSRSDYNADVYENSKQENTSEPFSC